MVENEKVIITPCGSPNCLAVAMEELLSKQTETLNQNLTNLIEMQMKGLYSVLERSEAASHKSFERLEKKHDDELKEVFLRLGVVEGVAKVVENRQVGTPKCISEMSKVEQRITQIADKMFSQEDRDRIIASTSFVEEKKRIFNGIIISVISVIIFAVLGWMLYIYGVHSVEKKVETMQTVRDVRNEDINKQIEQLRQDLIDNKKISKKE